MLLTKKQADFISRSIQVDHLTGKSDTMIFNWFQFYLRTHSDHEIEKALKLTVQNFEIYVWHEFDQFELEHFIIGVSES